MKLTERPVRAIIRAVSDAAARWTDGDFPPRVRALERVCARTGYTEPVVEYALDRLFESLDSTELEITLARELGDAGALDGFVSRGNGRRERAMPAGRVCVVSSRTTIGVAIVPAVFALLAKCDVLVKDREDALVSAFFDTLAEELDDFRSAAIAQTWNGESDERELEAFDVVVAFGEDATLSSIGRNLDWRTKFVGYGTKASAGYVARESLGSVRDAERVADAAARDLVLYETEGCMSLHALFVETGGAVDPPAFAELLARSVHRANVEFPPAERDETTVARVAAARDAATFRASQGTATVHSDAGATFVIECADASARPPEFLPRALRAIAVGSPEEARDYILRFAIPLEAIAVDSERNDVTAMAVAVGASRIAPFGALQAPFAGSRHGGRPRIAEFVRWVGDERPR
jgi:hypothetical protein